MKTLLFLAWRNLFRNPRRTAASLATVGLGATALLIFQGFNTGLMNQYRDQTIHGYYGFGQVFPAGYHGIVHEKPWELWIEDMPGAEKQLLAVPGVKSVFPRVGFFAFIVHGGTTLGGKGEGIIAERENTFFNQMNFEQGHDLQADDEIILGLGLAESLGVKVGDTVTVLSQTVHAQLNGVDLKVAGIFHLGIKAIDDQFFRIPLATAQSLLDTKRVEMFSLSTAGVESWPSIQKEIQSKAPNLEAISFDVLDKAFYQNSVDFLGDQYAFIRTIILFVVGLGILNTIAVGLLERAGEVGALRANGESRRRLFAIFFIENTLLGLIGGILGIIFAEILVNTLLRGGVYMPPGPGLTLQTHVYLEILPRHNIQAVFLPMAAAIVASLWPIKRLLSRSIPDLLRSN